MNPLNSLQISIFPTPHHDQTDQTDQTARCFAQVVFPASPVSSDRLPAGWTTPKSYRQWTGLRENLPETMFFEI